jgi:hypothetical protein
MVKVISSNIDSAGYDETTHTLILIFKNGTTYHYEGVPKEEYDNLLNAQSIGSYFSSRIRNKYVTRKVTD